MGALPPLTGGGVTIDGDISGDGVPGITLADGTGDPTGYGIDIGSSNNRLQALSLQGFPEGVVFKAITQSGVQALPVGQTFSGNVVDGLVIAGASSAGIRIFPDEVSWPLSLARCIPTACQTHNSWTDTTFEGNTIQVQGHPSEAIDVELANSVGDTVDGLTIERNHLEVAPRGGGINFLAGGGAHANQNRIEDVLVTDNTIEVQAPGYGFNAWSGYRGGSGNLISGLRIIGNTVLLEGPPAAGSVSKGITLVFSDDCYPPGCGSGAIFPQGNVGSNIQITGNMIQGAADGIVTTDPCCGGPTGSSLTGLEISGNTISTSIPPDDPSPWGIEIGTGGGLAVSNVTIAHNTITQQASGDVSGYAAYLAGGGIAVIGGLGVSDTSIDNVTISENLITSPLSGITVIGGGPSYEYPPGATEGNHVAAISVLHNTIEGAAVLATRWNPELLGISVIGGLGGHRPRQGSWQASGNSVQCVTVSGNLVSGRHDAVSVFANLGAGATGNSAQLGGC